MTKRPAEQEEVQPLWRRMGKGLLGAGITAAYITGVVLATPITLGITAGLGVLRGLATRDSNKQGLLSAIGKGAVQGMLAPFGAAATLAIDAIKGRKTDINDLILDSGRKMPDIPGFGRNSSEQPLWKRVGKVIAGAAMLGGTIAACVVAGPAVATFVAVAAATGAYKGYKETEKGGILGAIKGAVNRVLSPITTSALLIAHGVRGCETKSLAVNVFDGLADQFTPTIPGQKAQQETPPPIPPKPEHLRGKKLQQAAEVQADNPALPKRLNAEQKAAMRNSLGGPLNYAKNQINALRTRAPLLKPKKQSSQTR